MAVLTCGPILTAPRAVRTAEPGWLAALIKPLRDAPTCSYVSRKSPCRPWDRPVLTIIVGPLVAELWFIGAMISRRSAEFPGAILASLSRAREAELAALTRSETSLSAERSQMVRTYLPVV